MRHSACSAACASSNCRTVRATGRDILIEVEEAPSTTLGYGGGLEAGRRARTGDEGTGGRADRSRAARVLRGQPPQSLGQESIDQPVHARQLAPARPGGRFDRSDRSGRLRLQRISRRRHVPRAAAVQQAGRPAAHRVSRAGDPFELQLQPPRRAGGIRAAPQRPTHGERPLRDRHDAAVRSEDPARGSLSIDRLFPQVRLSTFTGSVLRDSRNDVLDPTRGTVTAVDGWLAARALGSEVGFVKSFAQAFWYRRLPRTRVTLVTGVRVGLAEGFERLATQVDADGQPILDPDGQPVLDSSTTFRRASGSSPAAIRPCAGSSSIGWARAERASLRSSHRHAQRSGVPDRRQRSGGPERRAQDGLLEGAGRRGLRRRRQRVSPRQSD